MLNRVNLFSVLVLMLLLSACASKTPAPVVDRRPATPPLESQPLQPTPPLKPVVATVDEGKTHTVQKGETLYAIAFQNNLDYRELAIWNNIENLNVIKVGAVLRLSPPTIGLASALPKPSEPVVTPLTITPMPSASSERPLQNSAILKIEPKAGKVAYSDQSLAKLEQEAGAIVVPAMPPAPASGAVTPSSPVVAAVVEPVMSEGVDWAWPVKGPLVSQFTEQNKGIDIAGSRGTAIHAAANGVVIHTGAGIRGYGRLVIIKHGSHWVSAYAHNDKIVVAEGLQVKQGQKIAEMGNSDTDSVKLHFEIRKQGKPVDPVKFLPTK